MNEVPLSSIKVFIVFAKKKNSMYFENVNCNVEIRIRPNCEYGKLHKIVTLIIRPT